MSSPSSFGNRAGGGRLAIACLGCLLLASSALAQGLSGDLPWQRGAAAERQPKDLTPRQMLNLLGIDESHWDQLLDGRPLGDDENETLTKLLFRMPRFEPPQWERWCTTEIDPQALIDAPGEHRGLGYIIRGRARQVETVEILRELAPLYEFRRYYRVTLEVEGTDAPVVVATRSIPAMWKNVTLPDGLAADGPASDTPVLDEPVLVRGIFLKVGEVDEETAAPAPLYFVAARLGWFPDQVNPALGVGADQVWLAGQGMDIALWDDVRENNGGPISAREGECFYQMLATLKRSTASDLAARPAAPFDLPGMLTAPDPLLGQMFDCVGTARRVQRVMVPEAFRERLGLSHYYEIQLSVPLDNQAIRLAPAAGETKAPTYTAGFPATFNVIRLPENLEEGENVNQQIHLKGVFFKLWAYRSDYIEQFNKHQRQPAPLLMGLEPHVVRNEMLGWDRWGTTVVLAVIVLGGMVVWFSVWRAGQGDRQFENKVLRKYTRGDEKPPSSFQMPSRKPDPPEST